MEGRAEQRGRAAAAAAAAPAPAAAAAVAAGSSPSGGADNSRRVGVLVDGVFYRSQLDKQTGPN